MKRFLTILIVGTVSIGLIPAVVFSADYSCTNCFGQVSSGKDFSCGVREDRSLTCWGVDFFGQATPPELPSNYDFAQVSTGGYHTCAVVNCYIEPGTTCTWDNVRCWGRDDWGQASPGLVQLIQVSAGSFHTCAVQTNGYIACWGWDAYGQSTPPSPPVNSVFAQVSAGADHSCAVFECSGPGCPPVNAMCWGSNNQGQSTVPGPAAEFSQISAGSYHTCAIHADGSVSCWGLNDFGQSTPPAGSFAQISAGSYHTCAIHTDGSVSCWGLNDFGQSMPPAGSFQQVSAGEDHTCGTRSDGSVTCWGHDTDNQVLPTAGLCCGLFHNDFEEGGDCRWSSGSLPYWNADCDGDGFASHESVGYCVSSPIGVPAQCPTGSWTNQPAVCGAFDCMDDNADVYSGQTSYFSTGYGTVGAPSDRFDYNCNGVEERRFTSINGGPIYCVHDSGIGSCVVACPPPPAPCYFYGWDPATVTEIPACGETADWLTCGPGWIPSTCTSVTVEKTQTCR